MGEKSGEFAVGDRVRQVIGGYEMTVEEVYDPVFKYRYRCVWTDRKGKAQHELFRFEQLERVHGDVRDPGT